MTVGAEINIKPIIKATLEVAGPRDQSFASCTGPGRARFKMKFHLIRHFFDSTALDERESPVSNAGEGINAFLNIGTTAFTLRTLLRKPNATGSIHQKDFRSGPLCHKRPDLR
jgi:hypothetical protein